MSGTASTGKPRTSLLGRVHLRLAAATIVLAGVGGGAIAILAQGDFEPEPGPQSALKAQPARPPNAPPPARAQDAPILAPDASEPAGRSLEGDPLLPPLAKRWRKAVVLSQRGQVLAGAQALRKSPDGKEQLLALMKDDNPRVRAFALRELGRRRDPSLTPALNTFLSDPDPYVVENARWALDTLERAK